VHETFGWIEQDIEDGYDRSYVGGYNVGSVQIEIFGLRNEQKRSESHNPSGLPQRLVHETFGWIEQDIENGTTFLVWVAALSDRFGSRSSD
jgi:hypothetical protein